MLPGAPTSFRDMRKIGVSSSFRSVDSSVARVTAQGLVLGSGNGGTLVLHVRPGAPIDTFVVHVGSGP